MHFGYLPSEAAVGAMLAHSLRLPHQLLKKGHCLTQQNIEQILAAGIRELRVARLDPDEVEENLAARRAAQALCGVGLRLVDTQTGRCNLVAENSGLLLMEAEQIHAINAVDEALTLATRGPFSFLRAGERAATVKTIPFAVHERSLARIEALAEAGPGLRMAPFRPRPVGLVLTQTAGFKPALLAKTQAAFAHRLAALGQPAPQQLICSHEREAIAQAMQQLLRQGAELLLIAGALQTADRRDLVPAAIEASGGIIDYFGMPVEPGNLLLLAHQGAVPIVGAPGCARSIKENGFDWVLRRLLADLEVTASAIQHMGVGGLL